MINTTIKQLHLKFSIDRHPKICKFRRMYVAGEQQSRTGDSPRLLSHRESLVGEADGHLPLLAGVPDVHLEVVNGPVRRRGTVSLHHTDIVTVVSGAEVADGHLVGGYYGEEARAIDGVELRRRRLGLQLFRGRIPLRRGPPPRCQPHRVHRRGSRLRFLVMVGHHSPIQTRPKNIKKGGEIHRIAVR
jgi:hypothetical protein